MKTIWVLLNLYIVQVIKGGNMRKVLKEFIIHSIIIFCFSVIILIYYHSLLKSLIVFTVLILIASLKPILILLDRLTMRTNWYKNKIGDGAKFCTNIPINIEVCNLGSNSAKYAFDYEETNLIGRNWALPQTLSYDFRVLKNYFSYLKEGGATVLIPLCPFSSCITDFKDDNYNYKYYSFLHPILIVNYSEVTSKKVLRFVDKPFQVSPLKSIIRIIHDIPNEILTIMNDQELEVDASSWIYGWKTQFNIVNLDNEPSDYNMECIEKNAKLLNEMVEFCQERHLNPIIIIPPMSQALSLKLTNSFRENYIYSLIKKAGISNINFLNYLDDPKFIDSGLYFNSYFLNRNGRKIFTAQVINDLGLILKR